MPRPAAALALILLVTGLLWQRQTIEKFSVFDQPFYLGIASDIVHAGRFTDGFMFADPGADGVRPYGMRFAPLYPAIVAAFARLDAGQLSGMDCMIATRRHDAGCQNSAPGVRWLQFLELAGFYWLVWWLGGAVGGETVGWVGLVLAFAAAPLLLRSVDFLMTEMTCLVLSIGAIAAAVKAVQGGARLRWSFAAGVLMALAALTRPAFMYLIPASALGALLWTRRRGFLPVMVMLAGAVLTLLPWFLRNLMVLGRFKLTFGYDSHTLIQRLAFNTMTWREYGMSFICWLPDGNEMGRALAGSGACDRFGWEEHSNSFYVLGLGPMLQQTLAASGGYEHHLGYLLRAYVLHAPVTHFLVSIPLALRGAYVAHWWGVVLLVASLAWTVKAVRRHWNNDAGAEFHPGLFLVVAFPAWFMLAFNAAVAVNQPRYNLMLIPAYAIAGALTLCWLARNHGGQLVFYLEARRVR